MFCYESSTVYNSIDIWHRRTIVKIWETICQWANSVNFCLSSGFLLYFEIMCHPEDRTNRKNQPWQLSWLSNIAQVSTGISLVDIGHYNLSLALAITLLRGPTFCQCQCVNRRRVRRRPYNTSEILKNFDIDTIHL
jgi:hypothetical protein